MSVRIPLSDISGCILNDKVQGMATLLYKELEIIVNKYGSDSVKDLMSVIVSILETLDQNLKEKQQFEIDLELSKSEFEHLKIIFDKEKSSRKSMETKYLEIEDMLEEMKKKLNQLTNTSNISTKQYELKIKNLIEQVERLEEKDQCNKEDYLNLHKKYSDLLKNPTNHIQKSSKTTFPDNPKIKNTKFNSTKTLAKSLELSHIENQTLCISNSHGIKEHQSLLPMNLNLCHHNNFLTKSLSSTPTTLNQQIINSDYDLTNSLGHKNHTKFMKYCSKCTSFDDPNKNLQKVDKLNRCKLIETNHEQNSFFIEHVKNGDEQQNRILFFENEKNLQKFCDFSLKNYENNKENDSKKLVNNNPTNPKSSILKNTQEHLSPGISQEDLNKNCNVDKLYGDCILASNQGQKYLKTIENAFGIEEKEESLIEQKEIITRESVCCEKINDFNQIHESTDISLSEELSILDVNNDIMSVGAEVEKLIQENNELLITKNALNVLKDDLIFELEDLSNEVELLKKQVNYLVLEKSEREIRIGELEKEIKKIKDDLETAQRKLEEKDRDSFSRVELVKILMERNQYKEKLMELQEAIRCVETMRAKKTHSGITSQRSHNNNSGGVWGAFNSLLGLD